MSRSSDTQLPSDVCLLLRADAEQRWLHREVIPVLRQIEALERVPGEETGAALAYLEAMWSQAQARAFQTDAAHGAHGALGSQSRDDESLSGHAGRYHAAVCVLRELLAARIAPLVGTSDDCGQGPSASGAGALADAPAAGGCAPKAA